MTPQAAQTSGRVAAAGRTIAYQAPNGLGAGPGHQVLLAHGVFTDQRIWRHLLPALAEAHRPVSIDSPAHGDSSGPAATSVAELADVLKAAHDALGLGRVVLIGHSMGGAIIQRYVAQWPQDVIALGLISTAPSFEIPEEVRARWLANPTATLRTPEEMATYLAPDTGSDVLDELLRMRDRLGEDIQRADLLAATEWDGTLTDIAVPTLAVTAEFDNPVMLGPEWASQHERATGVRLPASAHNMMLEQPALFNRAVLEWLDGVPA